MTELNQQSKPSLPIWKKEFIQKKEAKDLAGIKALAVFYKNAAAVYKEGSFAAKELSNYYLFGKKIYKELKESLN